VKPVVDSLALLGVAALGASVLGALGLLCAFCLAVLAGGMQVRAVLASRILRKKARQVSEESSGPAVSASGAPWD
jgi:hypothetical protein